MSDIGGQATGKGGDAQQTQYPYFQSAGGVTPEQTALADYNYGQDLTKGQGQFGNTEGPGGGNALSTMATQVATGAETGKALNLAGSSDANQEAEFGAFQNAEKIDQTNQATALAGQEQEQQDVTSLASLAGKAGGTAKAFGS
jgi:hypothetical protein